MRGCGLKRIAAIFAAALAMIPAHGVCEKTERMDAAVTTISKQTVGKYGMTPIGAEFIADGDYEVEVESSSPYFDVVSAVLHVQNGKMQLDFVIASKSYLRVYPGTAKEAKHGETEDFIEGVVTEDGESTMFRMNITALNSPFSCAAYSKRKKKWYSRTLLVNAGSLPKDALSFDLPDFELIEETILNGKMSSGNTMETSISAQTESQDGCEIDIDDGEYSIEVNMTGGSGRASVSSPTKMIVQNGNAFAELTWSSSHYDYMIVNGIRYDNLNTDGGSSLFRIPIINMDTPITVIADTTAMGEPVEITYTLVFYEDTIGDTSLIPQVATKRVLIVSGILIVFGAALNFILKKKKGRK